MSICSSGRPGKIILSSLQCVYQNLALEQWILNTWNLEHKDYLFIYRNKPAVVIGRFQNPWRECDVEKAKELGISIARRVSGGGTVYHDLDNINFSFFTDRSSHCCKRNLEFLQDTLSTKYSLPIELNDRNDLFLNDKKVSGSASRLIRKGAFHHCTLLINSNLTNLRTVLQGDSTLRGHATASVSSPTTTLLSQISKQESTVDFLTDFYEPEISEPVTTDSVIDCVMRSYLSKKSSRDNIVFDKLRVGWKEDTKHEIIYIDEIPKEVDYHEHQSDAWVFGKSPAFSKTFYSPNGAEVEVEVKNGLVESVKGMRDDLVGAMYNYREIQSMIAHFSPGDKSLDYLK